MADLELKGAGDLEFKNASALLFDPVGPNLLATRSILFQIGFERVEAVREYSGLSRLVADSSFDIAVLEVTDAGGDVCDLVRRMRTGETGINPFTVVIFTSWARSAGELRTVIDAGSDDVLLRPFSPSALRDRIVGLARKRKQFVVTGDYIGPDRRADPSRPNTTPTIDAPNSLKAVASGDAAALRRHQEAISAAAAEVDRERLRRLAMRISAAAVLRLEESKDADSMTYEDLETSSRELRRRLRARGQPEPFEISTALCEIVTRMREDDAADHEQLELVRDLPLGIYAALEGDQAADRARGEMDAMLKKIRARYERRTAAA